MIVSALFALSLAVQEQPRVAPEAEARPAYRELQKGERQVEGLLQRVECPSGRPVSFVVRVKDKPERFEAAQLADVEYIAHTPDFKGPMSCGGRGSGDRVRLTWKTAGPARRAVAIEFLPRK
jgi:hypothetical protein